MLTKDGLDGRVDDGAGRHGTTVSTGPVWVTHWTKGTFCEYRVPKKIIGKMRIDFTLKVFLYWPINSSKLTVLTLCNDVVGELIALYIVQAKICPGAVRGNAGSDVLPCCSAIR